MIFCLASHTCSQRGQNGTEERVNARHTVYLSGLDITAGDCLNGFRFTNDCDFQEDFTMCNLSNAVQRSYKSENLLTSRDL